MSLVAKEVFKATISEEARVEQEGLGSGFEVDAAGDVCSCKSDQECPKCCCSCRSCEMRWKRMKILEWCKSLLLGEGEVCGGTHFPPKIWKQSLGLEK